MTNLEMAHIILDTLGKPRSLIQHVSDRPGHDRRYAVDTSRLRALGWAPACGQREAVARAARWYAENRWWWEPIKSGAFREYYERNYGHRQILGPSAP